MTGAGELLVAIRASIERCLAGEGQVAIALSGGVDSSLVAFLAREAVGPERLVGYVVGAAGTLEEAMETHDVRAARKAADALGIALVEVLLDRGGAANAAARVAEATGVSDPFTLAIEAPVAAVAARARERVILLGQGADELFGGYARYARMDPEAMIAAMRADVAGLPALMEREGRIAQALGKEFRYPYLGPQVVALAAHLPAEARVSGGSRKVALRQVARLAGLPPALAVKEKKAAQYGSGTWRLLRPGGRPAKGNRG